MEAKKSINRKPVSKKTRFEVFKRDNFTCQYCSQKPPKVPLEIDHIIPVVSGGDNSMVNLITACFDCNRGKGARELTLMPVSTVEKIELMKVAQQQYKEFKKIVAAQKKLMEDAIDEVDNVYNLHFPEWTLSVRFRSQVKRFIEYLGPEECVECMEIACSRISDSTKVIKYFCGVCWNRIKNPEA